MMTRTAGYRVLALLYIATSIWLMSYLAVLLLQINKPIADYLDIFRLWYLYHDIAPVRLKLIAVTALPLLVPILVVLIPKKRQPLYGDARWANPTEIRKMGLNADAGIILGKAHGRFLIDNGTEHVLVAAPTRSGKGVGVVIPNLLQWPGSAVVLDVKFENYDITSHFRQAGGQAIYLFAPGQSNTHRWNPLDLIDPEDPGAIGMIHTIANILCPTPVRADDPMWTIEARNIFTAAVLATLTLKQPLTLTAINGWIKRHGNADTLNEFLDTHSRTLPSQCFNNLSAYAAMGEKQRGGVQSVITSALSVYDNPLVAAATATSDFDIENLRRQRMTIYLGANLESVTTLAPVYNLLFQLISIVLTRQLPDTDEPHAVLLLMDEFTALGAMDMIKKGIAFYAGYRMRIMIIIQGTAQLRTLYQESGASEFIVNFKYQVVFAPNDPKDARSLSEALGTATVKSRSKSIPSLFSGKTDNSETESNQSRALLLPNEILRMDRRRCIIFVEAQRPILGDKITYYTDPAFAGRFYNVRDPNTTPNRKPPVAPELLLPATNLTSSQNAEHNIATCYDPTKDPTDPSDLSPDQVNALLNASVSDDMIDALIENSAVMNPTPMEQPA